MTFDSRVRENAFNSRPAPRGGGVPQKSRDESDSLYSNCAVYYAHGNSRKNRETQSLGEKVFFF